MLGTIVNVIAVIIGTVIGMILKKILSRRITDTIMQGIGLATIIVGLSGALSAAFVIIEGKISSEYILLMIVSLAVGGLIGELTGIEKKLDGFAKFCENKFTKSNDNSTFAQGLVSASLVFCVGSMAIVGSLEDGINHNSDILFAKSALDGIVAMIFASTMGIGVLFSAVIVGVYQGTLTLLAVFIEPYLNDIVITQMSLIGSVLIMGIGLNLLQISKIKVGNLLPAIFIPLIYYLIQSFLR